MRHEKNPPSDWIRKDGAFSAIVTSEEFSKVQNIIECRSRHLDDDEMLALLKSTLASRGALSGIVIDEEDGVPSSSSYRLRFGSLLRAYNLIGFSPNRDYAYLEINKSLRLIYPELIRAMSLGIQGKGGWTVRDENTDLLTVNGDFTVSLVIAKCKAMKSGSFRWNMRFDASLEPDFTVVARMDVDNRHALDYYVFPSIDFSHDLTPTKEENEFTLDAYRMETLNYFYSIAGRSSLREVA